MELRVKALGLVGSGRFLQIGCLGRDMQGPYPKP